MTAYQGFAALYDRLMDDVDYDAWAAHYQRLLGVRPGDRVAELGCGTGEMTVRFAKAGVSVLGTDLSPEMIAVAQEKARAWGVRADFAVQDMARFALPRKVDAVFCACDGVNYLQSPAAVRRCFERVYAALKPGGVFAFDISAPRKLRAMAGQMFGEDRQDVAYLWLNAWREEALLLTMDLTFFVRQEGGLYRRFEERHVQRAHEVPELLQALRDAGFAQPRALSGFTEEAWRPEDERVHFAARKPMA
jgi:SAM-dependent methyltransferase